MAFTAKYVQRGDAIDYVPSTGVEAGEVVFIGNLATIAKTDILAGNLGAVATTGVYDVIKATGAVTAGAVIYWDAENGNATTVEGDYVLGVAIAGAEANASYVRILLNA